MFSTVGSLAQSVSYTPPMLKRSITLDQPSSDLTDFPILFSGTYTYLKTVANGGKVINSNGYDIIFYSDSALTTILDFERVYWDGTTGECEFWVKIPTLTSASATVIYIAYNSAAINTDQQNAGDVWSNNFAGVYHLADGTTLSALDSTNNSNDGTLVNTPTADDGKVGIGGGVFVQSSAERINLGDPASLQITGDLTISLWVMLEGSALSRSLVSKDKDTGGRAYTLDWFQGGGQFRFYIDGGGGSKQVITSTSFGPDSVWRQIVGVYNTSGTLDIYVNGASGATQVTGAPTSIPTATANAMIGGREFSGFENYHDGKLDEVKIAPTSRSSAWIAASYSNENDPANFYSIGSET